MMSRALEIELAKTVLAAAMAAVWNKVAERVAMLRRDGLIISRYSVFVTRR